MSPNRTPSQWKQDQTWRYGTPRRIVLSGEQLDPDPLTLPETAGEPTPSARRSRLPHDLALIVGCTLLLAGLYLFADWLVRL